MVGVYMSVMPVFKQPWVNAWKYQMYVLLKLSMGKHLLYNLKQKEDSKGIP